MSVLSDLVAVEKAILEAAENVVEAGVGAVGDALKAAASTVRGVIEKVGGDEEE